MTQKILKPGRPKLPKRIKRVRMSGVRIQQRILDKLMEQDGSKGKIVEGLLIEYLNIKDPH